MSDDIARTIITVKGVPVDGWEQAKAAAALHREPMGAWLGRAIAQLVQMEAEGPREMVPLNPAKLDKPEEAPAAPPSSLGEVAAFMRGVAAIEATSTVKPAAAAVRRAYSILDDALRGMQGLPPKKPRRSVRPALPAPQTIDERHQIQIEGNA